MHILTYGYIPADAATLLCLRVTSTVHNQRFSSVVLLCVHVLTAELMCRTLRSMLLRHVLTHAVMTCKTVPNVHCHISE